MQKRLQEKSVMKEFRKRMQSNNAITNAIKEGNERMQRRTQSNNTIQNAIKNAINNAPTSAQSGPIVIFQERSEKSSLYRTGTQGISTQQMCKNSKLRGAA